MSSDLRCDVLTRWRHRHGFGVHSPFAYQTIKRVVTPGRDVAYYGYDDIYHSFNQQYFGAREYDTMQQARVLLRLAVWVCPRTVALPQSGHPCFRAALRAYDSRLRPVRSLADAAAAKGKKLALLFHDSNADDKARIKSVCDFLSTPDSCAMFIGYPPQLCVKIFSFLDSGLLLVGKRYSLIFRHTEISSVAYSI